MAHFRSDRYPVPPPSFPPGDNDASQFGLRTRPSACSHRRTYCISPLGNSGIHQARDSGIPPREQSGLLSSVTCGGDRQTPRSLCQYASLGEDGPLEAGEAVKVWSGCLARGGETSLLFIQPRLSVRARRRTSHTPAPASTRRLRLTGRWRTYTPTPTRGPYPNNLRIANRESGRFAPR